ncbi:MAG: iron-containing alcohol dehydrogenase [Lachnospiraceae bacterium]|nr:iron-containing alcohol dehydrogenase [Lachnospiraceae bacterium]
MDNFTFYSPTYFVFGRGEEKRAGEMVKRFGGTKVLIHYGGGSAVRSGLIDRVKASLEGAGINYCELGGVKANPRSSLVYTGIDLVRSENVDFILAVGGGSVIDSAKAIAAGALYDGDFWDFYSGKAGIEKALPVGTVLTIAAAGSEGSGDSVITKEEGMYKRGAGGEALRPKFSILNPELTQTLPAYQTGCGITDIMAHLQERYFTNTDNVTTTDRMIEGLLLAMIDVGPVAIDNPADYEARANIMWAGMMAHNNSCGVGRSQDWNSHNIEHELSALYDCAHGAGLAVTFPAYISYVTKMAVSAIESGSQDEAIWERRLKRLSMWASRVWGVIPDGMSDEEVITEGIRRYRCFLKRIGMPLTLGEVGGSEADIDKLADTGCYGDGRSGYMYGFVKLSVDDVKAVYREMIM